MVDIIRKYSYKTGFVQPGIGELPLFSAFFFFNFTFFEVNIIGWLNCAHRIDIQKTAPNK